MADRWKTIRVFISSTFRDMHSERDWLVKRVFPALRERLEKYRVHLIDIDLRWGVTEQQAESGGALDVCLNQIDDCRPFFLGILGERYGFTSPELLKRISSNPKYRDLEQNGRGKSITELEILYGVLNDPKMHDHSLFCFRKPSFIEDVPTPKQKDVRAEDDASARKLLALKTGIEQAHLPTPPIEYDCKFAGLRVNWPLLKTQLASTPDDLKVLHDVAKDGLVDRAEYDRLEPHQRELVDRHGTVQLAGLEAFGEQVQEWLWEAIRRELNLSDEAPTPTAATADSLEEEEDFHERFMESRLRVHVVRKGFRNQLAEFADDDQSIPGLVTGGSGSGKSASLAHFVRVYRRARRRNTTVIPHFVGASPSSTNVRLVLRRFCLILKQTFGFTEEVEQDPQRLIGQFRDFLHKVPSDRRVLIVLDALNQLDDTDRAHQLHWLPWEFPPHVKVIVSCIDDHNDGLESEPRPSGSGVVNPLPDGRGSELLKVLHKRKHQAVVIEPLTDDERLEVVRAVPSLSAKTLDEPQVRLLLDNDATRTPLFLLVALEELRGFGSYEQLNTRIQSFPEEGDALTALFIQVIHRLETEFDADLTRDILTLLASARRGLSQRELQELLHTSEASSASIPHSEFRTPTSDSLFAILRQLRPYLQPRGKLLDFFHRNLFKAVREEYLLGPEAETALHTRLGDYFGGQDYFLESLEAQRARAQRLPYTARPVNVRKIDELLWQRLRSNDPTACETLLTDLNYLEARNEAGSVHVLLADFHDVRSVISQEHPFGPVLHLLQRALRRDLAFIARHYNDYPQALFQCLSNNLFALADEHHADLQVDDAGDNLSRRVCTLTTEWRARKESMGLLNVWVRSRNKREEQKALDTVLPHPHTVERVAVSPRGDLLATEGDNVIYLWNLTTLDIECVLASDHDYRNQGRRALSFSFDGRFLLLAPQGRWTGTTVELWNVTSGSPLTLTPWTTNARSAAFLPNSQRLIIGRSDGSVGILDWTTGTMEELLPIGNTEWGITWMGVSATGRRIALCDGDMLRVVDSISGVEIASTRGSNAHVYSMSNDGTRIARGDSKLRRRGQNWIDIWHIDEDYHSSIPDFKEPAPHLCWSPDDRFLATSGTDFNVRIWESASWSLYECLPPHDSHSNGVAFGPEAKFIASASPKPGPVGGIVQLCSLSEASDQGTDINCGSVMCIAVSIDGQVVVTGHAGGAVRIWNAADGMPLRTIGPHLAKLNGLVLSPNAPLVATFTDDLITRIWDINSGKMALSLDGHKTGVRQVAFSPDGGRLASASYCGIVIVWELLMANKQGDLSCREIGRLAIGAWAEAIAFSPDGLHLACATDSAVEIWNLSRCEKVAHLRDFKGCIRRLGFSFDGTRLVSESRETASHTYRNLSAWRTEDWSPEECQRDIAPEEFSAMLGLARRYYAAPPPFGGGETTFVDRMAPELVWTDWNDPRVAARYPRNACEWTCDTSGVVWAGKYFERLEIVSLEYGSALLDRH